MSIKFPQKFLFTCCVISGFLSVGPLAIGNEIGVVTKYDKRVAVLTKIEADLANEDAELRSKFTEVVYPFAFEKEKVEEPIVVAKPTIVVDKPPVVKVTDEEILERTAKSINPLGVMEKGGRGVITLKNNAFLEEGGMIRVNVQGEAKIIYVEQIKRGFFILSLNGLTFRQPINQTSEKNRIFRDPLPDNAE